MIPDDFAHERRVTVRGGLRDQVFMDASFQQELGGLPIKGVDPLDKACLDRPLAPESLIEGLDGTVGRHLLTILVPELGQVAQVPVTQARPVLGEILDGSPPMSNFRRWRIRKSWLRTSPMYAGTWRKFGEHNVRRPATPRCRDIRAATCPPLPA